MFNRFHMRRKEPWRANVAKKVGPWYVAARARAAYICSECGVHIAEGQTYIRIRHQHPRRKTHYVTRCIACNDKVREPVWTRRRRSAMMRHMRASLVEMEGEK